MSVYDIALDFVLLDAFDDLDHPPSTVVSVLQNRWITDGMKKAVSHWILKLYIILLCKSTIPTGPFCCSVVIVEGQEKPTQGQTYT